MYNFHDKLPINDSLVHGFVVAEDDRGNVIFKKSNMVVNGGREAIASLINRTILENKDNTAFKKFSSIKFGSNYTMTTPDTDSITKITDTGGKDLYTYDIVYDNETEGMALCEYDDDNNKYFKITVDVEAGIPAEIRELGLYFKDMSEEKEILFSRVVFDPIFCGSNAAISSFKVTYYVYL